MEILSPAGNLEKVKYAVAYGADAVYAGSADFSLRAKADNFSYDDLCEAVSFCHQFGRKLFVPLNIYAHNRHLTSMREYIKKLASAQVDAVIVSDLGVLELVKEIAPQLPIHISTQANATSYQAVKAYQKLGAKRVILARELTFAEIKEIREHCPDIELEIFVHGAMCISYSGRCLLSAYLNNRSANLGECTHPCRWKYECKTSEGRPQTSEKTPESRPQISEDHPLPPPQEGKFLVEESRPNQYFPVDEDQHGFYFMNSKDLCLWERMAEIYEAGINSVKIEGRMKSLYYIAATTRAYKQTLLQIEKGEQPDPFWREELDKVSHRKYCEGFFDSFDDAKTQNYESATYTRDWQFVGIVKTSEDRPQTSEDRPQTSEATVSTPYPLPLTTDPLPLIQSFHKITPSDEVELIFPDSKYDIKIKNPILYDIDMNLIEMTKPNSCFYIQMDKEVPDYGILRTKVIN